MQLAAVIENVTVFARLLLVSTELGRLLHIIQSLFISRLCQKFSFQECKQAKEHIYVWKVSTTQILFTRGLLWQSRQRSSGEGFVGVRQTLSK